MKIINSLSVLLLAVSSASAFAPASPPRITTKLSPFHANECKATTALFVSNIPQSNDPLDQVEADEITKFLVIDVNRARDELAANWGWITASGTVSLALGALALYMPLFATSVAYDGTIITIGANGFVGLASVFARENGNKLKSGFFGVAYMALAYYMSTHPGAGLDVMTLTIATLISAEGLYEASLAIKNKELQGRVWHGLSGVASVIAGLFITANIPVTSLVVPGIALGTRLTGDGATKVAIGLEGKKLADERK
mmetsp:Transcript_30736/g.62288  ORF Transcript_30736/g.62288 Transcript_30736/m.62288 type:complete len:256 (-) Transcript_30736:72-839(-)